MLTQGINIETSSCGTRCRAANSICWNGVWIFLFIAGIGIFLCGMPKYNDDYWYMWRLRPWFAAQGIDNPENGGNIFTAGIPWLEIVATWHDHFMSDNVRLGNILAPFLLLFPKWVGSGLVTLMMVGIVFMSFRIAGIDWRRSPMVPLALFAWTFGLPWRNHLGGLDFQLNYVFSSWLALLMIRFIMQRGRGKISVGKVCIGFALGVLAGMSHEIVGIPLLIGTVSLVLYSKEYRNVCMYMIILGLAAGVGVLVSSHDILMRFYNKAPKERDSWIRMFNLRDSCPFAVMVGLLVWSLMKKRLRSELRKSIMLFFGAYIVGSLLIIYVAFIPGRVWFAVNVVIIIVCMRFMRLNWKSAWNEYKCWNMSIAAVLLITIYVHLATVDYYSLTFRVWQREQIEKYLRNPDAQFFGKVLTLDKISPLAGYLPEEGFYAKSMLYVSGYFGFGRSRTPDEEVVVPEELRAVNGNSGNRMKDGEIREVSGFYFAPIGTNPERSETYGVMVDVDFGKGYETMWAFATYFTSEADGKRYVWIAPHLSWTQSHFCEIYSMRLKS